MAAPPEQSHENPSEDEQQRERAQELEWLRAPRLTKEHLRRRRKLTCERFLRHLTGRRVSAHELGQENRLLKVLYMEGLWWFRDQEGHHCCLFEGGNIGAMDEFLEAIQLIGRPCQLEHYRRPKPVFDVDKWPITRRFVLVARC